MVKIKNGEKPIVKKNIDISKISIPLKRFKMSEVNFIKWCASHGFTGKVKDAWLKMQPEKVKA